MQMLLSDRAKDVTATAVGTTAIDPTTIVVDVTPAYCEAGWISNNESCYFMDWTAVVARSAAETACTTLHPSAHLVSLSTDAEYTFLVTRIESSPMFMSSWQYIFWTSGQRTPFMVPWDWHWHDGKVELVECQQVGQVCRAMGQGRYGPLCTVLIWCPVI